MELTRRNFLKGTAGAAIAAGAATSVAVADEPAWAGEYDVIVVGAGGAGLTASITAADEGASVLLLEKCEQPNGNTPFCFGYVLGCDPEYRDGMRAYLGDCIGEVTPDDVLDAFIDNMCETRQWFLDHGANPDDMFFVEPNTIYAGEYPEFEHAAEVLMMGFTGAAGGPIHVQNFLFETAMATEGITYQNNCALEELVQDADGAVIGVVANGACYKANKGVIMCCGGFESDPEMVATYMGVKGSVALAGFGNTGDGHRAAMKAGADLWHMYGGALFWMGCRNLENTDFLTRQWNFDNKQWGIVVGKNGRRFYMDWEGCMINPPSNGSDLMLNVGYRHGVTQFGGEWNHISMPSIAWYIFDADNLQNAISPDLQPNPVADGWAYEAASLEELAAMIEVPVDELVATVDAWNASCDAGADMAFYRPAESLTKIATAPFYAMRCAPTILNTDGGPRRDAEARILDTFGQPIPHLYSAGEFGSVWGHLYQGSGNVGECLAFGRIAARSAVAGK